MAFGLGRNKKPQQTPTPAEAKSMAELALWFALSDDEVTPDELSSILATVREIPGMQVTSEQELNRTLREMKKGCPSLEEVYERVQTLAESIRHPELRRASFRLAIEMAAPQGEIDEDAKELLLQTQTHLGISDAEAEEILSELLGTPEEEEAQRDIWGDYPIEFRFAFLCICALASDGEMAPEEFKNTEAVVLSFLEDIGVEIEYRDLRPLIEGCIKKRTDEELLEETLALFAQNAERETLLQILAYLEMVLESDGKVTQEEAQFFNRLKTAWGIRGVPTPQVTASSKSQSPAGGIFSRLKGALKGR
jgi:tellurite resistance protein